jgi:hypothetical protein
MKSPDNGALGVMFGYQNASNYPADPAKAYSYGPDNRRVWDGRRLRSGA